MTGAYCKSQNGHGQRCYEFRGELAQRCSKHTMWTAILESQWLIDIETGRRPVRNQAYRPRLLLRLRCCPCQKSIPRLSQKVFSVVSPVKKGDVSAYIWLWWKNGPKLAASISHFSTCRTWKWWTGQKIPVVEARHWREWHLSTCLKSPALSAVNISDYNVNHKVRSIWTFSLADHVD